MAFKDTTLTFEDDKILTDDGKEVMMDWEAPIMEKTSEYICQSKGDILEIGFGMGICSDYIQAEGVNSHTIVEIHPQIIEKLKIWAEDKDNVTIVEGDWHNVELSGSYDGIFIDTYEDSDWSDFKAFILDKAKKDAKVSYWNTSNINKYDFDNFSYEVIPVTVEDNSYYTWYDDVYHMPKVSI